MIDPRILDAFATHYERALASSEPIPNAIILATVDKSNRPHSRVVLLKEYDAAGFIFYTNYNSAKGHEIALNTAVSLCFHWPTLGEGGGIQIRIEGFSEKVPAAMSDAYFATRPRLSQVGAWASLQSQTLPSRETFEQHFMRYEREFIDQEIPRPPHWGGYRVRPDRIEFWYGANYRLHERILWEKQKTGWTSRLLYP